MEQYMMYEKARLFGDEIIMKQILETRDPRHHKRLGRLVSGFKQDVWESRRLKIVYQGNHAKFSQNADLLQKLKRTAGKTLAEASPYDKIWGIGMDATHPAAKSREGWKGQNLLGEALTYLRCELTHESYPHLTVKGKDVQ